MQTHSNIRAGRLPDTPDAFIRLTVGVDGIVHAEGRTSCFLGHKLVDTSYRGRAQGVYAEWSWDGQEFNLQNGHYGMYPLYYSHQNGTLCVSTSIQKLLELGTPSELDWRALSVFLRIGHFVGDDTAFRHVKLLPPEAVMHWRLGRLTVSGYTGSPKLQNMSRKSAVDGFIALFEQSIRRRNPEGEFIVPLSGGRDSRQIFLELCKQGRKPKYACTMLYPPPFLSEDHVARELCDATGVPHRVFPNSRINIALELDKNLITNFATVEHAWALQMSEHLKGGADWLFDGLAGDVLLARMSSTDTILKSFQMAKFEELALDLLTPNQEFISQLLSKEHASLMSLEVAVDRLVEELSRHANANSPMASFRIWNRTRRVACLVPYSILERATTVMSPYLDCEVVDFLHSLPPSVFMDHGFHDEAIQTAYPEYSHIPFMVKGQTQEGRWGYSKASLEVLQILLSRQSSLVRTSFLMPRLIKCLFDRKYASSITWLSDIPIYLMQLENFASL